MNDKPNRRNFLKSIGTTVGLLGSGDISKLVDAAAATAPSGAMYTAYLSLPCKISYELFTTSHIHFADIAFRAYDRLLTNHAFTPTGELTQSTSKALALPIMEQRTMPLGLGPAACHVEPFDQLIIPAQIGCETAFNLLASDQAKVNVRNTDRYLKLIEIEEDLKDYIKRTKGSHTKHCLEDNLAKLQEMQKNLVDLTLTLPGTCYRVLLTNQPCYVVAAKDGPSLLSTWWTNIGRNHEACPLSWPEFRIIREHKLRPPKLHVEGYRSDQVRELWGEQFGQQYDSFQIQQTAARCQPVKYQRPERIKIPSDYYLYESSMHQPEGDDTTPYDYHT